MYLLFISLCTLDVLKQSSHLPETGEHFTDLGVILTAIQNMTIA